MAPPESGTIAVLAEKPSVARDIARVLGAATRGDGYLHGNGYVVTWAVGHLAALAQPHEINPEWRLWRRDLLPSCRTAGHWSFTKRPRYSSRSCAKSSARQGFPAWCVLPTPAAKAS